MFLARYAHKHAVQLTKLGRTATDCAAARVEGRGLGTELDLLRAQKSHAAPDDPCEILANGSDRTFAAAAADFAKEKTCWTDAISTRRGSSTSPPSVSKMESCDPDVQIRGTPENTNFCSATQHELNCLSPLSMQRLVLTQAACAREHKSRRSVTLRLKAGVEKEQRALFGRSAERTTKLEKVRQQKAKWDHLLEQQPSRPTVEHRRRRQRAQEEAAE